MDIKEVLATNLRNFRLARAWSQAFLAEKSGVTPNYIGMLENKVKFPSPETIQKLSAALDIDPTELFFKEIDPVSSMNSYRKAALEDICGMLKVEIQKMNEKSPK